MTNEATPSAITVSLEWAKKLKEAGWPQDESIFWLCPYETIEEFETSREHRALAYLVSDSRSPADSTDRAKKAPVFAAPTFEEIINSLRDSEDGMLNNIEVSGKWYKQHIHWDFFSLLNLENENDCLVQFPADCRHETWADLAAEYWCYLSNNNLLTTP